MTTQTVTIDRRVLEEAVATLEGFNNPHFIPSLVKLIREALNAQRTDEDIMRDGVAHHVRRYCNQERVLNLKVYPRAERDSTGMLEWIMRYEWETGGGITIGVIQRQPGAEVEYHS